MSESTFRMACTNCDATIDVDLSETQVHNYQECLYCEHVCQIPTDAILTDNTANVPERLPRDLKYSIAVPYRHDPMSLLESLKTHELMPPVSAFLTNIRRLKSLLDMPESITWMSMFLRAVLDSPVDDAASACDEFRKSLHEREQHIKTEGRSGPNSVFPVLNDFAPDY